MACHVSPRTVADFMVRYTGMVPEFRGLATQIGMMGAGETAGCIDLPTIQKILNEQKKAEKKRKREDEAAADAAPNMPLLKILTAITA